MRFGLSFSAALFASTTLLAGNAVADTPGVSDTSDVSDTPSVTVTTDVVVTSGTVAQFLKQAEDHLGGTFVVSGTFEELVIVPGLNELWVVDKAGLPIKRLSVTTVNGSFYLGSHDGGLRQAWNMSDSLEASFTGNTSALVGQVIKMLSGTVTQEFMSVPQGSRLGGEYAIFDQQGSVIGQWSLTDQTILISLNEQPSQSVPIEQLLTNLEFKTQGQIN